MKQVTSVDDDESVLISFFEGVFTAFGTSDWFNELPSDTYVILARKVRLLVKWLYSFIFPICV